jgi:predicted TIM-barrel fold metal-dependent hydrolase
MSYAHRPDIYDADTHMMETPDWIASFADPSIRPLLAPFVGGRDDSLARIRQAMDRFEQRRADHVLALAADRAFMSMDYKGWDGLGAFDGAERVRANDLLGFRGHLVFPTSAFNQVVEARTSEVLVGGVRALNRGMAAFCSADPRMIGTAYIPLGTGPETAATLLQEAIDAGFRALLIDTIAPVGGRSFTHPTYDPIWARIQDADLAVTLHVGANGGAYNPVPASFYDNGKTLPPHQDGDAPRDALSYMAIQYNAELFLAAMIFDGVLERFPRLRIGVIELGAGWIISWMKQLDQSHRAFRRLQDLSAVKMRPSDYVRRQIKVTPFAGEDIGWLLGAGAEDLLMFASDYPHHEGTDDPIGRFERTMEEVPESARRKFYAENFKILMGSRLEA